MVASQTHADWWKSAFNDGAYPLNDLAKTPGWRDMTRRQVDFISRVLAKGRGRDVLDVCCGTARHAIGLARKGWRVCGADISPAYLRQAALDARAAKVAFELVRTDARAMPFSGRFDAAINIFSSFGYFKTVSDDLKMLKSIYRALKPGGLFLLDTVNGKATRRQWAKQRWTKVGKELFVLEEGRLLPGDIARTHWVFIKKGHVQEMTSFIRMYDLPRLQRLLVWAGFKCVRAYGELDGRSYRSAASPRLAVLAVKPYG